MSDRQIVTWRLDSGLLTTPLDDGHPFPDGFREYQNLRSSRGGAKRRPGTALVAKTGSDNAALDFNDGDSEYVSVTASTGTLASVWTLGRKFTLEALVELDDTTGTQTILYAGATTPSVALDMTGGNFRARVWDSGATLTTLSVSATTSVAHLKLERDGADVTFSVNGTEDTDTMSATNLLRAPVGDLRIGRGASTDYLDGTIDYLRLFDIVRGSTGDGHMRFPDPYLCRYVLADYSMEADSDDIVWDRSRYENHGVAQNSPSSVTALSVQTSPVHLIHDWVDENETQRVAVFAGGRCYLEDVG